VKVRKCHLVMYTVTSRNISNLSSPDVQLQCTNANGISVC
jgi:hypothetical protein